MVSGTFASTVLRTACRQRLAAPRRSLIRSRLPRPSSTFIGQSFATRPYSSKTDAAEAKGEAQAKAAAEETFTETSTTADEATGKASAAESAEKSNTATPETAGTGAGAGAAADNASAEKLAASEKSAAEFKDKYLRQVAEFRNLQTRTQREVAQAKDFAIQKFAKDLIESCDNLERALGTVPEKLRDDKENHPDLAALYGGLKMTEGIMLKTLERHGLTKFTGVGDKFNPNMHEVLYEAPVPGKEAGVIIACQSTGFQLNGRTIRAAKVGVAKGSE